MGKAYVYSSYKMRFASSPSQANHLRYAGSKMAQLKVDFHCAICCMQLVKSALALLMYFISIKLIYHSAQNVPQAFFLFILICQSHRTSIGCLSFLRLFLAQEFPNSGAALFPEAICQAQCPSPLFLTVIHNT